MLSSKVIAAAAVAFLGAPASAFWRMECRGVAGQARIDPLMQPGTVGKHVHEIFGSGGKFHAIVATNTQLHHSAKHIQS